MSLNPANLELKAASLVSNSNIGLWTYTTTGNLSDMDQFYFMSAVPSLRMGDMIAVTANDGFDVFVIQNQGGITGRFSNYY